MPADQLTWMARETAEAPAAVARQMQRNEAVCADLAERFRASPPRLIATCARGSSDHAAAYAKYLMEIHLGIPVMSAAPSVGSIYGRPMRLEDCLFLVISQSGKSPDLVANARWAAANGAFVLAVVNEEDSPVAHAAHAVLPLHAGPEKSVAATKSYIASLSALLHLTSRLSEDPPLLEAFRELPGSLEKALDLSWETAAESLAQAESLMVVGRGLSFGIALEAALKLKETSSLHAEGVSGAEIMHGPLALVRDRFPLLVFSQEDDTRPGVRDLIKLLRSKGAVVFAAEQELTGTRGSSQSRSGYRLPVVGGLHPAVAPIAMIQSFYGLANATSLARGFDPDSPASLRKVTETL